MRRTPVSLITAIFVGLGILWLIQRYIFPSWSMGIPVFTHVRAALFHWSALLHNELTTIGRWRQLANENENLKKERREIVINLARLEALEHENQIFRNSLKLSEDLKRRAIPAGFFAVHSIPGGRSGMLNRGTADSIQIEDVVVTSGGALVGIVRAVHPRVSEVQLVTDSLFKVHVHVLGSGTLGIAAGASGGEMMMELVTQSDSVREGDTIISYGTDFFPAGLIIGEVRHVEVNEGELFKEVRISPAFQEDSLLDAIILSR